MVVQRVCMFVCDHRVCLGVPSTCRMCMRDVISVFNSEIQGSHASCDMILFLY